MSRQRLITALFALVILTMLAYLPILAAGFVWSDDSNITANPDLRDLHGLAQIWTAAPQAAFAAPTPAATAPAIQPGPTPGYLPLTFTIYWLEHQLWLNQPLGYHLVNLAFHLLAAGLVWALLARLGMPAAAAYSAALLFAIHPVNVESVAWASQLSVSLSLALSLAAALCWCRWAGLGVVAPGKPHAGLLPLAGLLFILALASRPSAAMLPPILLVIAWAVRGRLTRRDLCGAAPLFILALAGAWLALRIERLGIDPHHHDWDISALSRLSIALQAIPFYLGKLLVPVSLAFNYSRWPATNPGVTQYLVLAGIVGILVLLFALRRRITRLPLAVALIVLLALLPALGFVSFYFQRYSFVADRFAYGATIPVAALAACALWSARHGRFAGVITGLLLIAMFFPCFLHTTTFHDSETLYRAALERNSAAWMPAENLADLLLQENGRDAASLRAAIPLYRSALAAEPWQPTIARSLAAIYSQQGRARDAQELLQQSLRFNPEDGRTYEDLADMSMASLKSMLGDSAYARADRVVPLYESALRWAPRRASIARSLATLYLAQNRPADAQRVLEAVISADPEDAALRAQLADALTRQRKYTAADTQFDYANAFSPDNPQILYDWSVMLIAADRAPQAERRLRQALGILARRAPAPTQPGGPPPPQPGNARFHLELGRALRAQGDVGSAMQQFVEATRNDDRLVDAYVEAGNTILRSRENTAEQFYRAALAVDPDCLDAQVALAHLLATTADPQRRNPLEAVSLLRRAIETTHGQNLTLLVAAGDLLKQLKFYPEAADTYRRALFVQGAGAPTPVQREILFARLQSCESAAAPAMPDRGLPPIIAGFGPDMGFLNEDPPAPPRLIPGPIVPLIPILPPSGAPPLLPQEHRP